MDWTRSPGSALTMGSVRPGRFVAGPGSQKPMSTERSLSMGVCMLKRFETGMVEASDEDEDDGASDVGAA